jgi:hypothetical protein
LINLELQPSVEEKAPIINIITRGGTRVGVDVDNSTQRNICKPVPKDFTYEPLLEKKFFNDIVEIFQWVFDPTIQIPIDPSCDPHSNLTKNCVDRKDPLARPHLNIELWFHLIYDILDDEQLTKELQNKIKGILDIEMNPEELIVSHILERHTSRIQRRKKRYGWEFKLNTHITRYKIRDVMLYLGYEVNLLLKKT